MTQATPRLLIVYNADGGLLNALMHAVHKQVRPSSYPCSLCALTYGAVSMRGEWKRFLARLEADVVFHHRDDFAPAYPGYEVALPAILLEQAGASPCVLIGREELDAMADAGELIARLDQAFAAALRSGSAVKDAA